MTIVMGREMEFAFLILGMALVTYTTRYSMIVILGRWQVPHAVTLALTYVPMAAFAAIIAPEVLLHKGEIALVNARFIAGIAAILVAALTRHILLTIVVGMGTLWIVQALITH
jgi:branched-subunit amino acid transport protein